MKLKGAILVSMLLLMLMPIGGWVIAPVTGHGGVSLSAWTGVPPTIDGSIGVAEWAPADTKTFSMLLDGTPTDGTLYVMNDATNLYLAVMIEDDTCTGNGDQCTFSFDNDHDGIGPELEDDYIGIMGTRPLVTPLFMDGHTANLMPLERPCDPWGVPPGTTDGSGDAQNDAVNSYYEFSHPLDSGDIHDFSLSLGDTVGFTIWIWDAPLCGGWPALWEDYGSYGDIVIASPPPVTVYIDPPTSSVNVNSLFDVYIKASDVVNLWAWQAGLEWDPNILEFDSFEWGDFQTLTGFSTVRIDPIVDASGKFYYSPPSSLPALESALRTATAVTATDVTLLTVTFKAISAGTSLLTLVDVSLVGHDPFGTTAYVPWSDINGDQKVDIKDVVVPVICWEGDTYDANADFNVDNDVDINDIAIVTNDFGKIPGVDWGVTNTKYDIPATLQHGEVNVYGKGDTNGDKIVDIFDVVIAASAFGSRPGDPNWNSIADLYQDGLIDIFDLVIIGVNFGKGY